ncbi:MAG: ABC transporter substrate-binding protein [Actinobacteria bacterium]|nr:ABC transporter substrate-binding protein [Actinomycetota bacterium]
MCAVAVAACGGSSSSSSSESTESSEPAETTETEGGEEGEEEGGTETAKADCPVKVLTVGNFTGEGAENGAAIKGGAEAAIAQIEEEGGILGCEVELVTKDDGSDYTKALPLMQAAISEGEYAMVNNPDYGCSSVAPLIAKKELLSVTGCAVPGLGNPKYNPFTFETAYTGGAIAASLGKYLVEEKGFKNIALITDDTAYGAADKEEVEKAISEAGGKVSDVEQVSLEGVNFSSAISRAEGSNPEALIVDLFGAATGHFMSDLETSGWEVPTFGGLATTATNLQLLGVPKDQAERLETAGGAAMGLPLNERSEALAKLLKEQGTKIEGSLTQYAQNHDWMTLFAWGANKAGTLEPEAVTKALAESGETPIPNLVMGETTGYTPECHEFAAPEGIGLMKGGFFKEGGLPLAAELKLAETECPTPAGA